MTCNLCDEGWRITERGAVRCECQSATVTQQSVHRSAIDGISLAQATRALSVIGYFPRDPMAQGVIGDALASMCPNVDALRYVVRRACELYQNWERCGIQGLRQIVCYRYRPADGAEIYGTSAYPGGLPPDPQAQGKGIAAPDLKALPPGAEISADDRIAKRVRLLAHVKDINHTPKKSSPPVDPNFRPITEADVQREIEKRRDEQARRELYGDNA
jgi:hypothetical protein